MSNETTETEWVDPDDAPELTEEWFEKATFKRGDTIIRRGRPPLAAEGQATKRLVSLRLDEAVIAAFRATGPGWQTRVNEALRKAVGL